MITSGRETYHLFSSAIGTIGLAWSSRGLTRLQLPELDLAATEARLRRLSRLSESDAPPPLIAAAMEALERYLAGEEVNFSSVALDLEGISPFHQRVYAATRAIGWGKTESYGAVARAAGVPGAARAVGQALGRNPLPIIVPCHRVLGSDGSIGGFSAFGGTSTKKSLLALERVRLGERHRDDAPLLPGLFHHLDLPT